GTQPYTYAWTGPNGFSATTANINNLGAGTYNLLLTDTNGCTVSDSIQLRDSDSLQLTAVSPQLANGFNTTCNESTDGSIDLTVTGGAPSYAYLWTGPNGFNALTPDLTGLLGGNYVLNVTDINGCSRSINHVVTSPAAITIAPAVTMESPAGGDGAIDLTVSGGNAPYNYSWNNGETTEDIDSLTGGTYQVVVTDDFGCMDSLEITVGSSVGIATFEALQTLKVFPNPTKDRVWLQLNGATGQYIELEILDLNGRRVFNRSFDNLSSAWETDLPLNGWPQGVYFIRVQGDDFTQVQRLVVH
ncbi:MAG: T9SS type A sorting domain-containing protein, partial [Salibacteraceae bacterium]